MNRSSKEKPTFVIALLLVIVLGIVSMFIINNASYTEINGICFSSPDKWIADNFISCITNILILIVGAFILLMLNTRYNFMPHSSLLTAATYLLAAGAVPVVSGQLNASTLLAFVNIVAMALLFSAKKQKISAPANFLIASVLSACSTVQYAFLFYIPVYAVANIVLNEFRWKDIIALILGAVAPYWILLGLGIVDPMQLQIPQMQLIQIPDSDKMEFFIFILSVMITVLWSVMALLGNYINIISAGTSTRKYFQSLTVPLIATFVFMAVDYANVPVYTVSLALFAALQAGYVHALSRTSKTWLIFSIILVIYLSLFIMNLIYV